MIVGTEEYLALENGRGELKKLSTEQLKSMFMSGIRNVKLVFVSACFSQSSGVRFVEAGIEHVVAVKKGYRVSDTCANLFAEHFYIHLLNGYSVKDSFDIACNMIDIEDDQVGSSQVWVLLPEEADHSEVIFDDLSVGEYIEESPPLAFNNCDRAPKNFVGRNPLMKEILITFIQGNKRCVTIRGDRGIGMKIVAFTY